jgi:ABC-type spermidine/putrescine transport system permease subunit I
MTIIILYLIVTYIIGYAINTHEDAWDRENLCLFLISPLVIPYIIGVLISENTKDL